MIQAVVITLGIGATIVAIRALRGTLRARGRVLEGRAYPTDFAWYSGFTNLKAATENFGMPDSEGFYAIPPDARPNPSFIFYLFVMLDCLSLILAAVSVPSWPIFGRSTFFWLLSVGILTEILRYIFSAAFVVAIVLKTWGLHGIPNWRDYGGKG